MERVALFVLIVVGLVTGALSGCGESGSRSAPPDETVFGTNPGAVPPPPPTTTEDGTNPGAAPPPPPTTTEDTATEPAPFEPTYAGHDQYEERCKRISQEGAFAQVVYEASKEMKVGDPATVRAAVTLDEAAPPQKILPRTDAASAPGLVVSCRLHARLTASKYEFEIEPAAEADSSGWVERSVITDTANWSWIVKPKLGGDQTLTLQVRPFVIQHEEGGSETTLAAESDIHEYTTQVHVNVDWNERPEVAMTQIASTLSVGETLVKVVTGLVLALAALVVALGVLRGKFWKKRGGEASG